MFANTLPLCRLIFRRDWFRILAWFAGLMLLVVGFAATLPDMYPTAAERLVMAETMRNPAMVAMMGPVYTLNDGSFPLGALYANFMMVWTALFISIMNIFHVVRHTRQDEEQGRTELIRSLPVGRLSNLASALVSAAILNMVFAVAFGVGLGALGNEGMGWTGSLLFGVLIGIVGFMFAAVTAIFCQLCANARTAQALSFAFLIVAFLVRAVGDMQESDVLASLSPLGLILRAQAYVNDFWWPVLIALFVGAAVLVAAFWLCSIRDLGAGLIPARPGRRDAAPYLRSAGGLAWRLLRTPVIAWAIVMPILGMSYGSIMGDIESFVESNELFRAITGGDPMQLVAMFMFVLALGATIPVLQFILKARSQESGGYAEHILARSASRYDQLKGYFLIALLAAVFMPFLTAVGFWAGSFPVMEDPIAFSRLFEACMVYVPALFIMLGIAMVLIGYLPRFTSLAWAYLGFAFVIIYFGGLMQLPEWLNKLSPYGYIPQLPNDEFTTMVAVTMGVMVVLSAAMCVLGFIGYRRRDMNFS